jgi:hypothetical protein
MWMSLVVSALVLSFPVSAVATAEWMWSHGTSAKVEYPDRTTNMVYRAWGLDFLQNSGVANWVHFAVPTPTHMDARLMTARYIRIRFYTGSVDAFISDVHIYNGETKVFEFSRLPWANGWQTRELDLGRLMHFDKGLGVSLYVAAGVEMMSHRFIFAGAGGRFEW